MCEGRVDVRTIRGEEELKRRAEAERSGRVFGGIDPQPQMENAGMAGAMIGGGRAPDFARFRTNYRYLSPSEQARINAIKDMARMMENLLTMPGATVEGPDGPRCRSLAITRLEESVMWAVKSITG